MNVTFNQYLIISNLFLSDDDLDNPEHDKLAALIGEIEAANPEYATRKLEHYARADFNLKDSAAAQLASLERSLNVYESINADSYDITEVEYLKVVTDYRERISLAKEHLAWLEVQ